MNKFYFFPCFYSFLKRDNYNYFFLILFFLGFYIIFSILYIFDLLSIFYNNNIECVYSFMVLSYCNSRKNRKYPHIKGVTDEEIEYAKLYSNISDLDKDEKTLDYFLERDRIYNGDVMDGEALLELLNKKLKDSGMPGKIVRVSSNKSLGSSSKKSSFNKSGKRSYSTISNVNRNEFVFDEKSNMFIYIKNILNSDLSNIDKQIKIEKALKYFWKKEFEKLIKNSDLNTNKYGLNVFIREYKTLDKDLNLFLKDKTTLRYKAYMKVISNLEMSLVLSIILSKLIPFLIKHKESEEQNINSLYESIGRNLVDEYIIDEFKKYNKNSEDKVSFHDFKLKIKNEINNKDIIYIGFTLLNIMEISSNIFTSELITKNNETKKYYLPTKELFSILKDIMINDIEELPLVSPPEKWEIKNTDEGSVIKKYGGYLLNNVNMFNGLIRKSPENILSDTLINLNIVDSINYMSSIPFSINKKVLEIILNDNDLQVYLESLHKNTDKLNEYYKNIDSKESIEKINEITDHNSKYYFYNNIINIAKLYVDQIFYFTFFLDWRGRVYTQSGSLNFQSGDLAKSLILFNNGCVLNKEGLQSLKIYIANLYGKDKISHEKRLEWFDSNLNNILDINSGFWKTADEPYTFLAASLEYKEYLANPDNFLSKIPVLLDATCNGLQHLAAMSKDINLAKKVNLLSSNYKSPPEDCYSLMIEPIKASLNELIEKEPKYINLKQLEIKRILIKRAIMTIPYGVTIKGIQEQIINDHFTLLNYKRDNLNLYLSSNETSNVVLTYKEIYVFSSIVYKSLFNEHPMLNELVTYLKDMIKLLNQLNLPIIWLTPSGLLINQRYPDFKNLKFTTKIFGRRKSLTLREAKKHILNKQKQVSAFVPNFIHSMDASNIALLIKEIKKLELDKNINLLTIHDCFGTSANDASKISYLVKNAFIQIYSKSKFLKEFHDFLIEYIQKNNFELNKDKTIVLCENKNINIPILPKLGKLNIKDQLPNSLYFIN